MSPLVEIVLLAIVQGFTEFLPVSSDGHLAVLASVLQGISLEERLSVTIALHMGTLLAIVVFFWRRIVRLLGADRRVIGLIVVGNVPAAVAGVSIKLCGAENALVDPLLAGFGFVATGIMLLWAHHLGPGETESRELRYGRAFMVGLFQALAILPGVSRSGSTIVAGLGVGLKRDEAASFSFLLAIPAIAGAGIVEILMDILKFHEHPAAPGATPPVTVAIGVLVSFAVGLVALSWLVRWLEKGRLHYFAWWVLTLGPAVIAWQLWLRL